MTSGPRDSEVRAARQSWTPRQVRQRIELLRERKDMQISETLSQDLHKQFTVTFAASELDSRVNARLEEKKQNGKSIMGEVVEQAVNEGSQKAISDNKLKPALQPRVEPLGSVEDVVEGKADLTFK